MSSYRIMISRNEVKIIGNIGSNPIVRENTVKSVQFSVATSENWTTKEGEQKSITQWHKIVLTGYLCEFADILKAGMQVCIFGKIRTYQWQQNGEDKLSVKIIANSVFVSVHELKKNKSTNSSSDHKNSDDFSNISFTDASSFDKNEDFDDLPF